MTADAGDRNGLFRGCAALAVALHALVAFGLPELHGGEDLVPHLRLIERMGEAPALRNTYAPAYHALGALAAPLVGLNVFPKLFAFAAAIGLIAGFRVFQRAAQLPAYSAAVFCFVPYTFALSWCLPKVEAAGYALMLLGLALQLRRRHAALALVLSATFAVHTAAALLLGLTGGALALATRDRRALGALAAGTALATPLFVAHMLAGCTLAQAFLFSENDYLRFGRGWSGAGSWGTLFALAGPIPIALAAAGAGALWRRSAAAGVVCVVIAVVYLNEVWLAPFGMSTTLDLRRGLSVLAIPVAAAAGCALAARPRAAPWLLLACALWAVGSIFLALPHACFVRPIALAETVDLAVERCVFRWSGPHYREGLPRAGRPAKLTP